jgi:putative oxidoreductase
MLDIFFRPFIQGPGAIGLLLFRLMMGMGFVLHSLPKLKRPAHWMEAEGTPPDRPTVQMVAAITEFLSGMGFFLGLLTPFAAIGMLATMTGAMAKVHIPQKHAFVGPPGADTAEGCVNYAAAAVLLLLLGPGQYSIDGLWMSIFFK